MLNLSNYTTVSGSTTDSSATYTPPNGEKIYVTMMSGDAATSNDVKVEIQWDGSTIFSTHNSNTQISPQGTYLEKLEGNGSKQIVIKLVNNSTQSETIGGRIMGEKHG